MYDITVVGAGPAGSFCAYLLAKKGFHVALIEKKPFPRKKLCGGGVSYKAVKLLDTVVDMTKLKGKALSGSYLSYKNEHLTHVGQNITSYSIEREEFDNELLKAAKDAGVDVIIPHTVVGLEENNHEALVKLEDDREVKSNFLVLAEGINGKLFEKIGYSGNRDITMALEIDVTPKEYPHNFNNNTLFDFGAIPKGYAWIFPKDGYLNVGAYYYHSRNIDRLQERALECFVNQFSWAKEAEIGKIHGHALPYSIDYSSYNTNRTLLIGDSAGAVENFYGEGLYYGLQSSRLAAEEITNAIHNNASLDNFTKRLKSEILVQVKFSRITAHLFYPRQKFGYYKMVRNKLMNYYYAELIHGKISQRKCYFYTMASLPLSVFSGKLLDHDFEEVGLLR